MAPAPRRLEIAHAVSRDPVPINGDAPLGIAPIRNGCGPNDQIVIGIYEVPPSQEMEMGQIMPELAEQQAGH